MPNSLNPLNWLSDYMNGDCHPEHYVQLIQENFNVWTKKEFPTKRYCKTDAVVKRLWLYYWEIDFETNTARILESDYMLGVPCFETITNSGNTDWVRTMPRGQPKKRIMYSGQRGDYLHWNLTPELSACVVRERERMQAQQDAERRAIRRGR